MRTCVVTCVTLLFLLESEADHSNSGGLRATTEISELWSANRYEALEDELGDRHSSREPPG